MFEERTVWRAVLIFYSVAEHTLKGFRIDTVCRGAERTSQGFGIKLLVTDTRKAGTLLPISKRSPGSGTNPEGLAAGMGVPRSAG